MKTAQVLNLQQNRRQRRSRRPDSTLALTAARAATPAQSDSSTGISPAHMTQAVLLNWLGSQPVTFHRVYVDITGSVVAAVWLSFVLDRMATTGSGWTDDKEDYLFQMTGQECQEATGITRAQQQTCRKQLMAVGLLQEEGEGGRRAIRYRLRLHRLAELLLDSSSGLAMALNLQHAEALGQQPAGLLRSA